MIDELAAIILEIGPNRLLLTLTVQIPACTSAAEIAERIHGDEMQIPGTDFQNHLRSPETASLALLKMPPHWLMTLFAMVKSRTSKGSFSMNG